MRRVLAAAATVIVLVLALGQPAGAGESIDSGPWAGSRLNPQPGPNTTGEVSVTGEFRRSFFGNISLWFTVTESDGACPVADPPPAGASASPRPVSVAFTAPCNGLYNVRIDARSQYGDGAFLDQTVVVAMPAPTVTGVTATADGRSVDVAWDDMRPAAADLSGYVVERKIGTGDFEEIATPAADEALYTDEELPAEGGEATYRVLATRPVPGGATVTSQSSEEAATTFEAAPDTGTGTGGGTGGGGSGTDGGTGTGDGDGSGTGGGSGTTDGTGGAATGAGAASSSSGSSDRVRPPRVFSGTFLPPLLRPTPARAPQVTTTTVDEGYQEELPYGDRAPEESALAEEDLSSVFADSEAGRGMVIPVATALVLALWAAHLRMLARAARPLD